jgi:peroxiredoxin
MEMLKAGAKAPVFTLEDLSGHKQTLPEVLSRGPALVVLFKISCPVCQLAMPYVERISKGSLQVIAISQDDVHATARFQKTFNITLPTLLDREEQGYPVSNGFGISHVPSLFLVEPDGVISMSVDGFVKRDLAAMGQLAGIETFRPDEQVPEWKAG